jgi:hypothetical protein
LEFGPIVRVRIFEEFTDYVVKAFFRSLLSCDVGENCGWLEFMNSQF